MFTLSLLSRGHGKLVQNKQKLEVYFEPEVSLRAGVGVGHILKMRGNVLGFFKLCYGAKIVEDIGGSSLVCLTPRIAMRMICLPHHTHSPLPLLDLKEKLDCLRLDVWNKTRIPTWCLEGELTAFRIVFSG